MRPPVPLQSVKASQPVYLIQLRDAHRPMWYAFHTTGPLTKLAHTVLVSFSSKDDATLWAHSLESYQAQHGSFPMRDYMRMPKQLDFVKEFHASLGSCEQERHAEMRHRALRQLEVVKMPFTDVVGMTQGTGMTARVVMNPFNLTQKMDVRLTFDKAATCSRLETDFATVVE